MAKAANLHKQKNKNSPKEISEEQAILWIAERKSNYTKTGPKRIIIDNEVIEALDGDWDAAVLLEWMLNKFLYYKKYDKLYMRDDLEWLYSTEKTIISEIKLKRRKQERCCTLLQQKNLIIQKTMASLPGQPKKHFNVNLVEYVNLFVRQPFNDDYTDDSSERNVQNDQDESQREMYKSDELKCTECAIGSLYSKHIDNTHIPTENPALPSDMKILTQASTASAVCVCDDTPNDGFVPPLQEQVACNITSSDGRCQSDPSSAKKTKKAKKPPQEPKKPYGTDGIVMLSDAQHKELVALIGHEELEYWIRRINNWAVAKGKSHPYSNYKQAIMDWKEKNESDGKPFKSQKKLPSIREVNISEVRAFIQNWDRPNGLRPDPCGDKVRIEYILSGKQKTEVIQYNEKGFFEVLENTLRKCGCTKRK